MAETFIYTCEGCKRVLDMAGWDEYGHVCDGWWDTHGVFDALPLIQVERPTERTGVIARTPDAPKK